MSLLEFMIEDFEETLRVVKIDENTWHGAHPLSLPLPGARGVYGGHLMAQTLLVAIESSPGFVPSLFHCHFLRPGNPRQVCEYHVIKLRDDDELCVRQINLIQQGNAALSALCSFVRIGSGINKELNRIDVAVPPPPLAQKYRDPEKLHQTLHTEFLLNAYSDEFIDPLLCPEEDTQSPSERWICIWSKLHQPHKQRMDNSKYNYVGLADLSDAGILTTLARALHLHWNPTFDNPFEDFDEEKDARKLMKLSLNSIHLFHYQAMSLDHHLYFHSDDFDAFNIISDWISVAYQYKISRNNRTVVRGFFYDTSDRCVASFVQEGLTLMQPGVYKDDRKL